MLSDRVFQSILPLNDRKLCPYEEVLTFGIWSRFKEFPLVWGGVFSQIAFLSLGQTLSTFHYTLLDKCRALLSVIERG